MAFRPLPIRKVREISEAMGADGVAVFAFKDGQVAGTSYGATKDKCALYAEWLDTIIDGMGDETIPEPGSGSCPWPRLTQGD